MTAKKQIKVHAKTSGVAKPPVGATHVRPKVVARSKVTATARPGSVKAPAAGNTASSIAPDPVRPPPTAKRPRRATRTSGNPLTVVLIVGLVIAVIATVGILHGRRQAREQRLLRLAIEERQEAGAQALRRTAGYRDTAQSIAARVAPLEEQVEADLQAVLGEGLRRVDPGRERRMATTQDEVEPDAVAPARRDPSAPEGIPTREELEARRRRAAASAPPAAGAAGDPVTDEIRALGDAFVEGADLIAENAAVAMDLFAFSEREAQALQRETRLVQATDRAAGLATRDEAAEELVTGSREALERLNDLVTRIAKLRERHEQVERERREQEAAARRAREQAEQEQRERALAATYREQADERIAANRYEDALETAERQLAEFRSERGRQAHQLTIDQCRELVQLKTFLIESLTEQPMSWGWTQTPPARDILGADRDTLHVRGSTVAWADVSVAQMARIVDHHLGDPRTPPSRVTRFGIGAALFYHKAGQRDRARAYVERAVGLQPSQQHRADRLMPRED